MNITRRNLLKTVIAIPVVLAIPKGLGADDTVDAEFAGGVFKAPVAGVYRISATINLHDAGTVNLKTSSRTFRWESVDGRTCNLDILADLQEGDTAFVETTVPAEQKFIEANLIS